MCNKKITLIFALLFVIVTYPLQVTQAMESDNVTITAQLVNGTYTSPKGLVYTKGGTVKDRLDHIQQHIPNYQGLKMSVIQKKPLHSFFKLDITEHNDIIDFVDTIYTLFQSNEFNFNITTTHPGTTMPKNIVLHNKEYQVIIANDISSGNSQCKIIIKPNASDPAAAGYPVTGKKVNNDTTYGYKLTMNLVDPLSTAKLPTEVQSFFPF
jgi:hypothetical protein